MNEILKEWESPQKILVILAHPDDPEFFLGATIAMWTEAGHQVHYCLLTCGDKGASDRTKTAQELTELRKLEQASAANVLGVQSVSFLGYTDGELIPSLESRMEVTRVIRRERPDIVVSCDPTNIFPENGRINHPDHRAVGQIVTDAIFPGVGNPMFFPEMTDLEGLDPHSVKEYWMSLTSTPNVIFDVSVFWETKIQALLEHKSQIGSLEGLIERMRSRRTADSTEEHPRYEERFRRILFR